MIFNLSNQFDIERLDLRITKLKEKQSIIDLKEKKAKRTLSQNSYLHVCITMYAIFVGETLNRTKTDLKRACPFMVETHKGKKYLISSADLDTKGMTDWIEWIRNFASQNGVFIPSPDDYHRNWAEYEKEIEQCKPYL